MGRKRNHKTFQMQSHESGEPESENSHAPVGKEAEYTVLSCSIHHLPFFTSLHNPHSQAQA
jgi:hypothetical protein